MHSWKHNVSDGTYEATEEDVRQNKSFGHYHNDYLSCVDPMRGLLVEKLWPCLAVCHLASLVICLVQSVLYPMCEGGHFKTVGFLYKMNYVMEAPLQLFWCFMFQFLIY